MRLIDADDFKKFMQALCKAGAPYGCVVDLLDTQPTAYDVDKVVEELYEERTEILLSNDYECEIINYCLDNFDKAIEIIKAGVKNE